MSAKKTKSPDDHHSDSLSPPARGTASFSNGDVDRCVRSERFSERPSATRLPASFGQAPHNLLLMAAFRCVARRQRLDAYCNGSASLVEGSSSIRELDEAVD